MKPGSKALNDVIVAAQFLYMLLYRSVPLVPGRFGTVAAFRISYDNILWGLKTYTIFVTQAINVDLVVRQQLKLC